jgi:hypothetical protein
VVFSAWGGLPFLHKTGALPKTVNKLDLPIPDISKELKAL